MTAYWDSGALLHDFLHAVAAEKTRARLLLSADEHDFDGLTDAVKAERV